MLNCVDQHYNSLYFTAKTIHSLKYKNAVYREFLPALVIILHYAYVIHRNETRCDFFNYS